MKNSKAQIIATLGPSSSKREILKEMIEHQMDVARINLSWGNLEERKAIISLVRTLSEEFEKKIPIMLDLPGPRIQKKEGHGRDQNAVSAITKEDEEFIKFGAEYKVDYIAVSFVGGPDDIKKCRKIIEESSGEQKIVAKIERKEALDFLSEIISVADAVMVARGDLGNEIPIEQVPFTQDRIIKEAKKMEKPVIVATEMLLSMKENPRPTRAEVTDVANAILEGADAVMLSEETAIGKYPVETVTVMEKIVLEAEKHLSGKAHFNIL